MGSSSSPLVSNDAMHPWNPDFEATGLGNEPYMLGRTPPKE